MVQNFEMSVILKTLLFDQQQRKGFTTVAFPVTKCELKYKRETTLGHFSATIIVISLLQID